MPRSGIVLGLEGSPGRAILARLGSWKPVVSGRPAASLRTPRSTEGALLFRMRPMAVREGSVQRRG